MSVIVRKGRSRKAPQHHSEAGMASSRGAAKGRLVTLLLRKLRKQGVNRKWGWATRPQGQPPVTHFLQ